MMSGGPSSNAKINHLKQGALGVYESAQRVQQTVDALQALAVEREQSLSEFRKQERIASEQAGVTRDEQLAAFDEQQAALETLPEKLLADAEQAYASRERWLQKLGKRVQKKITDEVPLELSEAATVSDAEFARSSKMFAEFNKRIGEAEDRLNGAIRGLKRWNLTIPEAQPVGPMNGNLEQILENIGDELHSLEGMVDRHNAFTAWLFHQWGTIGTAIVLWLAGSGYVLWEVWQIHTAPRTLFIGSMVMALVALIMFVSMALGRGKREKILGGLMVVISRVEARLQTLRANGQRRLDMKQSLVDRVDAELDREEREKQARARASR